MRDALRMTFGTLTALPVPAPTRIDRRVAGRAMVLAPLPGILLAAGWVVIGLAGILLGRSGLPALVTGGLSVAYLALATRGLHLDGLADTCDGLSASYDRERALAVMKTGDVGPSGAAAIALVVLVQAACFGELAQHGWWGLVAGGVAVVLSRQLVAWACNPLVPAARSTGLGAAVAGTVPVPAAAAGWGLCVAVSALGLGIPPAVAIGVVPAVVVTALLRRVTTRLGGMSGDMLGALVEVGLTAGLVAAVVVAPG
ncbi:adenosylcobinamide-GDP ribazoletransferase [Arsenicicoccus piscis]|uniref:Adenosylcobinamide-GDP ribazoletransferase n=1 Tax=Arsenicicoccus piscis TaxID=673954 RepID=A0ABQ6HR25_9MICO|nr:adenosylcobinamide-GDP ribazoletransferase [Arsenicicoccus piscis]MCH8628501.1 adenosylcobinamide-GDP ribazoletransferase [Arsenicicoccus piscis]GMA19924.1 adenosylcobinamide-GDP ribazoletransferase [Arsenicicoccus piscis]